MELFKTDGHLTHDAYLGLLNGTLNELQSLEVSEHLSFCDECLSQYLAALDGTELLEPALPLAGLVMKKAKGKARAVMFARYTSVAAAAALAAALWGTGLLTGLVDNFTAAPGQDPLAAPARQQVVVETDAKEPRTPMGARLDNAVASVNNSVNSLWNSLFSGAPTPAVEENPEPSEREQREALFDIEDTGNTD